MQQKNQTTSTAHWWTPSSSHRRQRTLLLIALSLSLALLLFILYTEISRANSKSAAVNNNPVYNAQPAPVPIAAAQTSTDTQPSTIETIRERGYLIVGVKEDAPPFGFYDEITNDLIGFEVELVLAMAAEWGLSSDDVLLEPVTSANRIQKLLDGEVDLIVATMTHNKARDELIDFSQTYFLDGQDVLVRADSGITQVVDLAGKSVAAAAGSTSIKRIIAYADERQIEIEPVALESYPDAVERLLAGQIDAVTTDRGILTYYAADPELVLLRDNEFTELTEPYGMGVSSGDSYFLNLVNFTLQDLKRNGTYDELYMEWFGHDSKPYTIELLPGEWPYTLDDSPVEIDSAVESKVDQLQEKGYFIAGVKADAPPFGYIDEESGALVGFEVDLMKEFARRWLGDEEAVLFEEVTSATRIDKLAKGEIDIIAATMTHTQPRDELIDFSQTYFRDGQTVLVRLDSGILDFNALDGKIVAGIAGSTSISRVLTYAEDNGITIEVAALEGYVDGVERLRNGDVDAITTDKGILTYFAQQYPEELMLITGETFSDEPYGLGVPNFDHRFRDLVNFTLQEMWEDGSYARLYAKWFGDAEAHPLEVWPGVSYLTEVSLTPMVRIPEGEFLQGNDGGRPNEQPERLVTLDEYYIDQFEVTNRLYRQCITAEACTPPVFEYAIKEPEYFLDTTNRNHPVAYVSWEQAATYCAYADKRLPTEAEWEKAARGPYLDSRNTPLYLYPWGDNKPTADEANYQTSGPDDVVAIGSYPAGVSPYGLYDMAGNVREWTADWYSLAYYRTGPDANPLGPDDGGRKVVRGGGFNDSYRDLTTTRRRDIEPDSNYDFLGFRCAADTPPTLNTTE